MCQVKCTSNTPPEVTKSGCMTYPKANPSDTDTPQGKLFIWIYNWVYVSFLLVLLWVVRNLIIRKSTLMQEVPWYQTGTEPLFKQYWRWPPNTLLHTLQETMHQHIKVWWLIYVCVNLAIISSGNGLSPPSHYLKQCRFIFNWTLRSKHWFILN